MELNSDGIERQQRHLQHTARRWIREGGVVIAPDSAGGNQTRLEFAETVASGVSLQMTFNLREVSKACRLLTDYAVYLWNCDEEGDYMLYAAYPTTSYLRAELHASNDLPAFKRVAATCYAGRFPDMLIDIYDARHHPSAAAAASLLTRMLLPKGICAAIYQRNVRRARAPLTPQLRPTARTAHWDS